MKTTVKNVIFIIVGFCLLLAGVVFAIHSLETGVVSVWSFASIGIGSGIAGAAIGQTLKHRKLTKDEDFQEQMRVLQKDERNIVISNRAKAKAFSISIYLYAALMIAFLLLRVHSIALLLLTGVYLSTIVCYIVFFNRYSKTM